MNNEQPIEKPATPTQRQMFFTRALNFFRSKEGEGFLTSRKLLLLALTAIYFISPIDVIPDFIPGIGQLDDITVLIFALTAFFAPAIKSENDEDMAAK